MDHRIFALASISALSGLVGAVAMTGCSSSEEPKAATQGDAAAGTPDGGSEQDRGRSNTSQPSDDEDSCVARSSIDETQFPYTKAVKAPGACTNNELSALGNYFKENAGSEDIKASDWAKVVSDKCATCVFSDGTGAEWTPILTKNDKLENVNRGGCIEVVSGKRACGEAYQHVADCRLEACLQTCETQDAFSSCLADTPAIFRGPCKQAYDTLQEECGNELEGYEKACKGATWTFEGPIRAMCIDGGGN
ncbi:MAG TPA: hypothetical protein VM580_25225 [Labilithrix sp.]|nr:hypothetical protein [Labilithrix sp.]